MIGIVSDVKFGVNVVDVVGAVVDTLKSVGPDLRLTLVLVSVIEIGSVGNLKCASGPSV